MLSSKHFILYNISYTILPFISSDFIINYFAYDCYRRFIQMYSDVVIGVGKSAFEKIIDELKEAKGVKMDTELTADDLKELIAKFKAYFKADSP